MADAATEFVLNNLKEILVQQAHLIGDTRGNIENLQRDLEIFRAFLKDTVKQRKNNAQIQQKVKDIHDVVYDVEDIIDVYVTKIIEKKASKTRFFTFFKKASTLKALHSIGEKVEGIKGRVEEFRKEISLPSIGEDKDEKPEARPPRDKDVVGFEEVTDDLTKRLLKDTEYLDVISLIGMFGLGKTTLAWKIYNDPDIGFKFRTRIWLPVSQQFKEREIFLRILSELTTVDDDIRAKDDQQLAKLVAAYLQNGNFLIVMDDVWSEDDWDRLRRALPSDNNKGKVLITSRHKEVGEVASKPRPIYNLRFFTEKESWELFQLEAIGKPTCPSELEDVGRIISKNCDGLPLAIVVIGGILFKSLGTNMSTTRREWERVSKDVISYLSEEDKSKRMQKFISLSYENLPYHLRACFLYLGLFPEDYEIPVSKLIRMWIGEGFVQQKPNNSLEEIGEKYLKDLINRNLVKSVKFKPDGKVKTCQIHDTLRDFCRTEAETENFLKEIKYDNDGECVPPLAKIPTYRRLSIHSNCMKFISSDPFGPRVRSFVCFSDNNKYVVSAANSPKIIQAFKLVRVLDVLPFKFDKIDNGLYDLIHMRYMALSFKLAMLPSHFNKLWNIQTLIIDTTSPTLKVEADIWKMKHLRHFKTNASAILPSSDNDESADQLQTLGLISVDSCTEKLPKRARNLKKLGIRGKLALLFETGNRSFDSLGNMRHLGKLKLVNDELQEDDQLNCLPRYDRFPSGLTSLTLCSTFLNWDHISILGMLKKLEVLKLKDRAFIGDTWKVDGSFHSLEFLLIEQTDLIYWKASSDHFPNLRSLVLKDCTKLSGIPIELAGLKKLQMLELSTCIAAVPSAKKISKQKKETQAGGSEFTLSIYPPTAE